MEITERSARPLPARQGQRSAERSPAKDFGFLTRLQDGLGQEIPGGPVPVPLLETELPALVSVRGGRRVPEQLVEVERGGEPVLGLLEPGGFGAVPGRVKAGDGAAVGQF